MFQANLNIVTVQNICQLLLLITSDILHGVFSCILQRPTAKDLLKHQFIRKAKKTAYLVDLIEKYRQWKASGGGQDDDSSDSDMYVMKHTSGLV